MGRSWGTTGDDWMGAPAAARYLGINLTTLYAIIDSGQLPAYKIRRVIRLRRSEVQAFIQASRVQPGSLRHLYPPGEKRPESSISGSV